MLEVVNPANETVITRLETDQKQTVTQKFAAAKVAQLVWLKAVRKVPES